MCQTLVATRSFPPGQDDHRALHDSRGAMVPLTVPTVSSASVGHHSPARQAGDSQPVPGDLVSAISAGLREAGLGEPTSLESQEGFPKK